MAYDPPRPPPHVRLAAQDADRRHLVGHLTVADRLDISPAAQRIVEGALFDLDGDHYWAETTFPSDGHPAGDVVILRGVEYMRCDQREVRRAVQIRDIEAWIQWDRIDFAFGPSALDLNVAAGWTRASAATELPDIFTTDGRAGGPVFSSAQR